MDSHARRRYSTVQSPTSGPARIRRRRPGLSARSWPTDLRARLHVVEGRADLHRSQAKSTHGKAGQWLDRPSSHGAGRPAAPVGSTPRASGPTHTPRHPAPGIQRLVQAADNLGVATDLSEADGPRAAGGSTGQSATSFVATGPFDATASEVGSSRVTVVDSQAADGLLGDRALSEVPLIPAGRRKAEWAGEV